MKKIVIITGAVVLVIILLITILALIGGPEEKAKTSYKSDKHNFGINFSQTPEVADKSIAAPNDPAKQIPYTLYDQKSPDNTGYRAVSVTDYSYAEVYDEDKGLNGSLDGSVKAATGTEQSRKSLVIDGHKAIEGHYITGSAEKPISVYIRAIVRNKVLYSIIVVGEPESAFKEFADSFVFTN